MELAYDQVHWQALVFSGVEFLGPFTRQLLNQMSVCHNLAQHKNS
jgi:hypothetical protein